MAVNGITVYVDRGGLEKALRVLTKKRISEGVKESEQRHHSYMKPSDRLRLKKRRALARLRKKDKRNRPPDPDLKPTWATRERIEPKAVETYDAQAVLVD